MTRWHERPHRGGQFCAATPNVAGGHVRRLSPLSELVSEARPEKISLNPGESETSCCTRSLQSRIAHGLDESKRTCGRRCQVDRQVAGDAAKFDGDIRGSG